MQQGSSPALRSVQNKLRDVVSVLDFGAINTGQQLTAPAIQRALDCGADTIIIPAGQYQIDRTLTISKPGLTLITNGTIRNDHTQDLLVDITASSVKMRGGSFRGNVMNGGTNGIIRVGSNGCIVEDVKVQFSNRWGVQTTGNTFRNTLRNVLGVNLVWNRDNSSTVAYGCLDINGFDHWIQDCEVGAESGKTAITANAVAIGIFLKGSSHIISNSYSEFSEIGMRIKASDCQITNCRIDYSFGDGLVIDSDGFGNLFTNFKIVGCGWAADNTYRGIVVKGQGNQFEGLFAVSRGRIYPGDSQPNPRTPILKSIIEDKTQWTSPVSKNKYSGIQSQASAIQLIDYNTASPYLNSHYSFAKSELRLTQSRANSTSYNAKGVTHIDATACSQPTTVTDLTGGAPGQKVTMEVNSFITLSGSLAGPSGNITFTGSTIVEYVFVSTSSSAPRWRLVSIGR